jgi:SepF-like predicted cell division protein (DUF552 family)
MQHLTETINYTLREKLQKLVSFLAQVNRELDAIAEEIDNEHLKTAMITVAVESKQYAKEICHQLQQLNISISVDRKDQLWQQVEDDINNDTWQEPGGEIATLCSDCEKYFSKLYEDVLTEYFPYKKLKDIISFQLYAARCSFMRIRLLNSLRFDQ